MAGAGSPPANENVAGEREFFGRCERFRGDRSEVRIVRAEHAIAAGDHFDLAFAVILILGVEVRMVLRVHLLGSISAHPCEEAKDVEWRGRGRRYRYWVWDPRFQAG